VESGPLGTIRNILLWSLLAGSAGILVELLLIGTMKWRRSSRRSCCSVSAFSPRRGR
jgi:hypothetical protein